MAFYTGTCSSFSDLQTIINNNCSANGWTLSSGILSKSSCFFKLTNNASLLALEGGTGQSGSTLTGNNTFAAALASASLSPITFPCKYDLHILNNPDEVYCVINYNTDKYQHLAFGKSNIPGIGGTGAWYSGSYNSGENLTNSVSYFSFWDSGISSCFTYTYGGHLGGLFVNGQGSYSSAAIHTGLDSVGWKNDTGSPGGIINASRYISGLLTSLPNTMNNSTVLIPIKPIQPRASNGLTIVANLNNARYCRIDNIASEQVIIFGTDKWKCYPFYRKDSTLRDGAPWATGTEHSGTFGFAIRYTGP